MPGKGGGENVLEMRPPLNWILDNDSDALRLKTYLVLAQAKVS
jgi:hypothetical protein